MKPLTDILLDVFGSDFPVRGGSAKRDDPLVVTATRDFVSIEYLVAEFLLTGDEYQFEKQHLYDEDGRKIDELVYAARNPGELEWTVTRRFFFDITDGYVSAYSQGNE